MLAIATLLFSPPLRENGECFAIFSEENPISLRAENTAFFNTISRIPIFLGPNATSSNTVSAKNCSSGY
jgi:hypothetical protein